MSRSYLTLDWATLHADTCRLAALVGAKAPWRGIVAVTRGGMIPAAIVARELGIRLIETVSVATYDEETKGTPSILKAPVSAGDGDGFLVIDDLVDTGITARAVRNLLPKAHLACVYAKPEGQAMADSWIRVVDQETWIVFPWDVAPDIAT
jgi:xanthine phosphoribosyltransferase